MADAEAERRYRFAVGLWLRVIAAGSLLCLLFLFTLSGWAFPYSDSHLAYYGLGLLVAVNGPYWVMGMWAGFPFRQFYFHWLVDLALISFVVYGLGGSSLLPAITGYMLIVVSSAVLVSRRASFWVATGGAIAFGASSIGESVGWIEPAQGVADPEFIAGTSAFVTAGSVVMVYLSAYIAGTLGNQLNAANDLLAKRNERLREQNDTLDKLRKELEFQTNVLTHDIRSPVSAAAAVLGELRKEVIRKEKDGECVELLRMAEANLDRVEAMIGVLQEVQEQTRIIDKEAEVNLTEIVEELALELQPEVTRKKVTVLVEKNLPAVQGIRQKLVVLFRNLLSNAIRYVPADGTGMIRIGVRHLEREFHIFVADNGEGILPEHCAKIFDMFWKAPQGSSSGGMGMGLALVRKIVEQHGGRAWAESDGHRGAVLWVSFPAAKAQVMLG